MIAFVSDREIYGRVVRDAVPRAEKRVWIATADIKDLHVDSPDGGRGMVPFTAVLAGLVRRRVEVRLVHAKEPGPNFRADFDRFPELREGMERVLCPRVHFKCIVLDGRLAYFGSANLTGAGMGAKSAARRNFENGVWTDEPELVRAQEEQFDAVWRGERCRTCGRRRFCGDPIA